MANLKQKIKKAINESDSEWKATKVWEVKTETTIDGHTIMWIEVSVKKR